MYIGIFVTDGATDVNSAVSFTKKIRPARSLLLTCSRSYSPGHPHFLTGVRSQCHKKSAIRHWLASSAGAVRSDLSQAEPHSHYPAAYCHVHWSS